MKKGFLLFLTLIASFISGNCQTVNDCSGGWEKYEGNPVLGGALGTIFDVSVLRNDDGTFWMYNSWRNQRSIALSESKDGLHWSTPIICLPFNNASGWEDDVNRVCVIKKDGLYLMWYTGQVGAATDEGRSWIGYATSKDGKYWKRMSDKPVMSPELPWEDVAVMCPHVLWDNQEKIFKMWYSAGQQREPNSIGYATSKDGIHWEKYNDNPILTPNKNSNWAKYRVTGQMVIKRSSDYLMFYIGFKDDCCYAQIGMARSKNGITNWEEYKDNPIIWPGSGWDSDATYKPYPVADPSNNRWLLYYNGRRGQHEQMGVAIHKGMDLGF